MVIHDAATFPGLMLACRIVGILQIRQKNKGKAERNDRLFAVPRRSHSERGLRDVPELSKPFREELGNSSSPRMSLRIRSLTLLAGRDPRWRKRQSKMPQSHLRRRAVISEDKISALVIKIGVSVVVDLSSPGLQFGGRRSFG
jgi:hypothetical protein